MNILITGSSGFIGKHLVNFIGDKESLHLVGRNKSIDMKYMFTYVDLRDTHFDWSTILQNIDVVVHLAALAHNKLTSAKEIDIINVASTRNLATHCAKANVKKFIFLSSIGVYGNSSDSVIDEASKFSPESKYAVSKLNAEKALIETFNLSNVALYIIRPTLVYGEGAPGNFRSLVRLVEKSPVLPFGRIQNKRSFLSVHNLVDVIYLCALDDATSGFEAVLADNTSISTTELIQEVARNRQLRILNLFFPQAGLKALFRILGMKKKISQLVDNLEVDNTKIRKCLNWSPKFSFKNTNL